MNYVANNIFLTKHSADLSGLVVTRMPAAREGPSLHRTGDKKFVFSRKSLRYADLGMGCTLTAVPRSTA